MAFGFIADLLDFFGERPTYTVETQVPAKGEKWRIKTDDPFPPQSVSTILEVKEGWVRYRIGEHYIFCSDERMPISNFVKIYQFYSNGSNS